MPKIGLQLYSVKEAAETDLFGTLRQAAAMGYDGVEFAGFFGVPAEEVQKVMDDCGLVCAGSHIPYDRFAPAHLEETLEYHHRIGVRLLICPYLPGEQRQNIDDYRRVAEDFNRIGEACRRAGFTFGYHNHAFEFEDMEGRSGWEVLWEETDPEWVKMELDCYWAVVAGIPPSKLLERDPGRFVSLHVKDLKREGDGDPVSTEIGSGEIDYRAILQGAGDSVPWIIAEQEHFEGDPMNSAEINHSAMRELLKF